VAAEQDGLRNHRELHCADAEAGPDAILRKLIAHRDHCLGCGWRAPWNAEAELKQWRRRN
jgi:hypothetical protein